MQTLLVLYKEWRLFTEIYTQHTKDEINLENSLHLRLICIANICTIPQHVIFCKNFAAFNQITNTRKQSTPETHAYNNVGIVYYTKKPIHTYETM